LLLANERKARRERLGSKPSRRRAPKRWPPGRSAAPATRQGDVGRCIVSTQNQLGMRLDLDRTSIAALRLWL